MKANVAELARSQAAAEEKDRRLREIMAQVDGQMERLSLRVAVADGSPERPIMPQLITNTCNSINEVLASPDLHADYRRRAQENLRAIERTIYEKSVNHLLDVAIERVRARDATGKAEMLTLGRAHYAAAMKLGASSEFRDIVRRKIDIINNTSHVGDSAKAKKNVIEPAQRPLKPEEKLRRFVRFVDPPLTVVYNGATYRTADWSLAGLLIENFTDQIPGPKEVMKFVISVEGDDQTVNCVGLMVKYNSEARTLAVRLTENMSSLLPLMNRMRALGMKPIV